MGDILNISKPQARILQAIAYYEKKAKTKGATQYNACSNKVTKEIRASNSTFNENIGQLKKKLMVLRLKERSKTKRKTKPYTITEFGQIAWLRHNTLAANTEIIHEIFPNIQFFEVDEIIDQIYHPGVKIIKNNYSKMVLKSTLDSFHIENSNLPVAPYMQKHVIETIELSEFHDLLKTSWSRYYKMIDPSTIRTYSETGKPFSEFERNFNELEISIIDRITFLFYYNLIQSGMQSIYSRKVIFNARTRNTKQELEELLELSKIIAKKKKEFLKIINDNEEVTRIIQINLKDMSKYKDTNFQDISKMFIKN